MVIPHIEKQGKARDEFAEMALPLLDSLYNFACWLAHDPLEAEDLVQETFLKALRGFSSFQAGTNFRAWIFRILRNTFLNSRTGLAASLTAGIEEEDSGGQNILALAAYDTPEAIFFEVWNQEALRAAIASLPVPFREVLLLADVEEMPYREIAKTLGVPMGTVMSRLARARKQLCEALKDKVVRA